MNWKWEAKVDDSREKQKLYEEQKKAQLAQAKSVDDLRRIERNMGTSAVGQITISLEQIMLMQMQQAMNPILGIKWGEPAVYSAPTPLPEEHIVNAIVGYRAWNVPLFVDELRSVAKQSKWKPYQRFEAECKEAQCNGVSCSCGIYAFNKMELVQKEYTTQDRSKRYVYGECHLWGRVLECKDGYRAQFGYPKALINTGAIAKRMAEVFGIGLL